MDDLIIKKADNNILKELKSVKFDVSYINEAVNKYRGNTYKIFNLKSYEANILKQMCLSLGFDCAVSRDTVTCKCEFTDCIVFATDKQFLKLISELKKQPFRLKEISVLLERELSEGLEILHTSHGKFDWKRPYVAGILNVTPDSFSDGEKYILPEKALIRADQMIQEGADIIDIGGESSRPGAKSVSVDEEIKRVIPVIELLRKNNINTVISVDTINYETAKEAVSAGADIINDVSGFEHDDMLFKYVCANDIPCIVMHSDKLPASGIDFTSRDIVEEVYFSLHDKINKLINSGLSRKNIIADVGFGFGKSGESNFEMLRRSDEFTSLKVPLMSGISRKSFISGEFDLSIEQSDIPSAFYAATSTAVNIHRVHNVKLTVEFLKYANKINPTE